MILTSFLWCLIIEFLRRLSISLRGIVDKGHLLVYNHYLYIQWCTCTCFRAVQVVECSALERVNMNEVFEEAVRAALRRTPVHKRTCQYLWHSCDCPTFQLNISSAETTTIERNTISYFTNCKWNQLRSCIFAERVIILHINRLITSCTSQYKTFDVIGQQLIELIVSSRRQEVFFENWKDVTWKLS